MKTISLHLPLHAIIDKLGATLLYVVLAFVGYVILMIICRVIATWRMLKKEYICFELTPPMSSRKLPQDTDQLFRVLHTIGIPKKFLKRLKRGTTTYALEVVADSAGGLRFVARIPKQDANQFRHNVTSYNKLVQIREVPDHMQIGGDYSIQGVADFKLTAPFVFPLKIPDNATDHDAYAYILGAMTELQEGEKIVVQYVLFPSNMRSRKRGGKRFINGYENSLRNGRVQSSAPQSTLGTLGHAVYVIFDDILDQIYGTRNSSRTHANIAATQRTLSQTELDLVNSMRKKVKERSFYTSVRVLVISKNDHQRESRITEIRGGLDAFSDPEHQGFKDRVNLPGAVLSRYRLFLFQHRLPAVFRRNNCILSTSEMAGIYHFPYDDSALTEGLVKSLSRKLSPPLSLKNPENFDVVVGRNVYQGQSTEIGLAAEIRRKHMYLIGSTGTGKSTLLEGMIYQDIMNGKGLAVLDPHGDMYRNLLSIVPKHRQGDIAIFDPSDRAYPPGLNILSPGIDFKSEEDAHSWIKSSVVSVFSKLTDKAFWGPRMEHILECATLTALQLPDPSLYTLQKLLTDKRYMRDTVKKIKDPILKEFWLKEMLPLGDAQLATTVAPLTHRVGKFITDPMARNILLQPKTTLRLSEIMNEGKILFANLSKGDIGEDQSRFFGTLLTSLMWVAAYQRIQIPESKRRDFMLYVDEFQNYAAPGFSDISSEGRKFRIPLITSHQNTAQIEDQNLLKIMAGNAHTFISLRSSPNDEAFILPFMEPAVEKGNIVNLAPHHFFMKTTTDESELAFSGVTVPLNVKGSEKTAQSVINKSRQHYATPRSEVESYLNSLFEGVDPPPSSTSDDKPTPTKDEP